MSKQNSSVNFSRKQIYDLAKAYSEGKYTYADFDRQYQCNRNLFYSLLHISVGKCIVNDTIAKKIAKIAANSSSDKVLEKTGNPFTADQAYARVWSSWMKRIEKRRFFAFSKKDAQSITIQYANNSLDKEQFCKSNYLSKELFDSTLKKAIILGWVNDEIVQKLFEKSKKFHGEEVATKLFQGLEEERSKNVKVKRQ